MSDAGPEPGILYRDDCPPSGQVRMFAVNAHGERCFEVTVAATAVTPDLIARWREDALAIGSPPLALVRNRAVPRADQPRTPKRRQP